MRGKKLHLYQLQCRAQFNCQKDHMALKRKVAAVHAAAAEAATEMDLLDVGGADYQTLAVPLKWGSAGGKKKKAPAAVSDDDDEDEDDGFGDDDNDDDDDDDDDDEVRCVVSFLLA